MTFNWNPITDGLIKLPLEEDKRITDKRRFVRDIVMTWLNEKFMPSKPNFTIFDKCILLFDKSYLYEVSLDYYNKLILGEKHWIEYVHSISEDIRCNFGKNELKEILKIYNIANYDFVERVSCVSGFIQDIESDFKYGDKISNISEYLNNNLEKLGNFYDGPYISETFDILTNLSYSSDNLEGDALKEKIIKMLDSKKIPTEYEDPLMFDRCLTEEDEKMFDRLEKILEKRRKNKRKPLK